MNNWMKKTLTTYIGTVELDYHSAKTTEGLFGPETKESHFTALLIGENDRVLQMGEGIGEESALMDLFTKYAEHKMLETLGRI